MDFYSEKFFENDFNHFDEDESGDQWDQDEADEAEQNEDLNDKDEQDEEIYDDDADAEIERKRQEDDYQEQALDDYLKHLEY